MPSTRGKAYKGSQKWLQILVNNCPEVLNREIARRSPLTAEDIYWLSPLQKENYREYYDKRFLDELGISLEKRPLESFWPSRGGPHWDALGRTDTGRILLVEAKSHIKEMAGRSRRCQAKPPSRRIIENAFAVVKKELGANLDTDWLGDHYQYANRLAHLFLLRTLNDLSAFLIMLYFLDDAEQGGPSTIAEWQDAIAEEEKALGIPQEHSLSNFVIHAFIDVNDIEARV